MFDQELLKGTLRTLILWLLREKGTLYGYQIKKLISEFSDEKITLTDGALYPLLHKLEKEGFVTSAVLTVANRRRKYYDLTSIGLSEAMQRSNELLEFIRTILTIVAPK